MHTFMSREADTFKSKFREVVYFSYKVCVDFYSGNRQLVLRNEYLSLSTMTNLQWYCCCFHGVKEDLTSVDLCGSL